MLRRASVAGLVTLLHLIAVGQAADLGLSPPRIDVSVPAGGETTVTFSVLTGAATEQNIAAELSDWVLNATGGAAFLPPGTHPHSAADWFQIEAEQFSLGARAERPTRLAIAVPPDAEGTHHAIVFFTVVPPPTDTPGVGVTTTTRVGLTVYVTVTGTERSGSELVDLYRPDPTTLAAIVVNTGNTVMRLGGAVELRNEAGDAVHRFPVPDVPVLRESEREVRFALPDDLEPGFYVVLALIEDDRGGVLAGELPIELP